MKLSGWTWLIVGLFMAGISSYIYFMIPKPDGSKNLSMALFFFIAAIFIVIGLIKVLFRTKDSYDEKPIKLEDSPNIKPVEKPVEHRVNRVEQQVLGAVQKHHGTHQQHAAQHHVNNSGHTNSYARTHDYKGPVYQHQSHQLKCAKCNTINHGMSNFCHKCGNRLK